MLKLQNGHWTHTYCNKLKMQQTVTGFLLTVFKHKYILFLNGIASFGYKPSFAGNKNTNYNVNGTIQNIQ